MNASAVYLVQIKQKEKVLFQDAYNFKPSSTVSISIPAASFNIINGGILAFNVYRLEQSFFSWNNWTMSNNGSLFPMPDLSAFNATNTNSTRRMLQSGNGD
jgi:hypothetical protein